MKVKILELIDFEKVDILLEGFNQTTGFVTAILDLEGKVLSKSGWRQMCTHFHRMNPESAKLCTISDTVLANSMAEGEKYHFYRCLNGLVDVAVPIVINGEHIANLFSGQFFFEEPDREFFKKQAEKYGFNESKYIESMQKVPVLSKEKVKTAMNFMLKMTQLITEMTFQKLEQIELNKSLLESEEKYRLLYTSMDQGMALQEIITDSEGRPTDYVYIDINASYTKLFGITRESLGKQAKSIFPEIEQYWIDIYGKVALSGEPAYYENYFKTTGRYYSIYAYSPKKYQFASLVSDITDRKLAEEKIQASQAQLTEALDLSNRARRSLLSVLEDQRHTQQEINKLNAELEHRVEIRTEQLGARHKKLEEFP